MAKVETMFTLRCAYGKKNHSLEKIALTKQFNLIDPSGYDR